MHPYLAMLAQQLMAPQQPQLPRDPNNFDQMIVQPFGWPNDKNSFRPDDIATSLNSPWAWQERP